ncbi:MAG: PP2C family protein-serine/threonine phosphatase [Roseiflexus sp.]|nr:PP2C family protein-serine/threonine phosphatase [Roseiflexus sp.]MCS7289158.1 PP2C family protein-serine/threonine phosphatase [Roseiflexus sp.]MDW8234241.1 PP2C family protein-serine/threonine phosphatase [Roseiflexaceae bacterium]
MRKRRKQPKRHFTLLSHIATGRPRRVSRPAPPQPQIGPEEARRQAEIERELLLARDIQQGLLLEAVPHLPGWEIHAISLPARDLGGDLYDFLPLGNGRHGIMIGDVSGKGLPAALRMAVARTVFRYVARRGAAPGSTLADVNRGIIADIPQGMITMLYAMLDLRQGIVRIANAGHHYPLLLNGRVSELELSGLPLGVDDDAEYEEICVAIEPGNTVIMYTDGVVEATNSNGKYFGYERLERLLTEGAALKPRALVARLLHELRTWSDAGQDDDITVVAVRRRFERLADELRSIMRDVLGEERGEEAWQTLPHPGDSGVAAWTEALPEIVKAAQSRFGRGLARELNAQIRLALEEYRDQKKCD